MITRADIQTVAAITLAGLLVFTSSVEAQTAPNPELGDVTAGGQAGAQPAAAASGGAVWSTSGQAQRQAQPAAFTTANANAQSSTVGMGSEQPAAAEAPAPGGNGSDHSAMVNNFGIGFFGVTDIPIGGMGFNTTTGAYAGADFGGTVSAPTIGLRYWLMDWLGIEGALGIGIESSSQERTTAAGTEVQDPPSGTAFALHGGVPLALAYSKHFVFEVVPELNLGFSTGTVHTGGANDNLDSDISGILFQLGARAGAEIHFGFIGIPQLALQGTVGLHVSYESRSLSVPNAATNDKYSRSKVRLGTSLGNSPWDFFRNSITAIYYFD